MNIGTHHAHLRKRLYKNLEKYPHPKAVKRFFDYLMYSVGMLAPLALLPQVQQVYVYKNVAGLSILSWTLLGGISFLWALYGMLHKDRPIIIANVGMAILNFAVVAGIYFYR